ncbi:3-oxoacyl-ACP synthase [Pedobacter sp. NJ-S-72]
MINMEGLKAKLYQSCMDFIMQRINTAETALQQAQEASNDDTKSSAGDKFETTREMMQQDIARNKNLLLDAKQNLQLLTSLEEAVHSDVVRNGALVYTSNGIFYICISAGQLKADDQWYLLFRQFLRSDNCWWVKKPESLSVLIKTSIRSKRSTSF